MFLDPALRIPVAISLGAIAGALSRYYLTLWFASHFGLTFPLGTFVINGSGCFAMGLLVGVGGPRLGWSQEVVLLLTTGFLGAYTTFSTYGLETVKLVQQGRPGLALLYWLGSAVVGVCCVVVGGAIARWF